MYKHYLSRITLFGLIALALVLTGIPSSTVQAAAGDLDTTFGTGGKVTTDFRGYGDYGRALAIQDDGKIIAAGISASRDIYFTEDFAIARYNPDGSLDPTFGTGGKVVLDFFGDQDQIHDVAVQPDHKIVAVGFARAGAIFYTVVVRYNPDGTLDSSFGTGGKVLTLPPGLDGEGNAVVIQPDNKIVVAGRTLGAGSIDMNFGLWRYNPNGSLDSTFGTGGYVATDISGSFGYARDLVLQPDGKLVAGGFAGGGNTRDDYAMVRCNPDGSLDPTFGAGGKVITDFFGQYDFGRALALQADGKLVMAGEVELDFSSSAFGLARYNPNGTLDPTFGVGGKVTTNFFGAFAENLAVAIQADGKILTAGRASTGVASTAFALAKFNPDGSLDAGFGSGGKVLTQFGNDAGILAVIFQGDGKIIALGDDTYDFALARYNNGSNFNLCIQDDSSGNLLQINTTTGEYQFTNCGGLTIGGTGTVTKRGSTITFQHNSSDRRVTATADTSTNKATASIQLFSQGRTFTITDRDLRNNTCACR